jgi:ribosome-binding protein aMBF1 (putative translation factor)
MDFTVEFYETAEGRTPVQQFLDELRRSDPGDFVGLAETVRAMKTNFDNYLEQQLKDPDFAARFEKAGEAWDVALQIAALRQKAGLSQKDLARILKTSQQNISRLESPSYEGHSLAMLRRVANALGATLRVSFTPKAEPSYMTLTESAKPYKIRKP